MIMSKGNKRTLQTDSRKGTSNFALPAEQRLKAKSTIPENENDCGGSHFGPEQGLLGRGDAIKPAEHMELD